MKLITIPFTFFICMFIAVGGFIYDQAFMAWAGTIGVVITIGYCLYALANASKEDEHDDYHDVDKYPWRSSHGVTMSSTCLDRNNSYSEDRNDSGISDFIVGVAVGAVLDNIFDSNDSSGNSDDSYDSGGSDDNDFGGFGGGDGGGAGATGDW